MPTVSEFNGKHLAVDVDSNGQIEIKTRDAFGKELRKITTEIADLARTIVRTEHEGPRKVIVNRRVATKPSSGNLRRSIQPYAKRGAQVSQRPGILTSTVTAGSRKAPYAKYVHEGTRAHVIRARSGKNLLFPGTNLGSYTFTRKRLLPADLLDAAGQKSRKRKGTGPRRRLRYGDADVYAEDVTQQRADRSVMVPKVDHPGYRGHRFINQAAAVVIAKYGGRIGLPRR